MRMLREIKFNHFEAIAYFLEYSKYEQMFAAEAAAFDKAIKEGGQKMQSNRF